MPDLVMPTAERIENCALCGWQYLGDGMFCKGDWIGYFSEQRGFVKR